METVWEVYQINNGTKIRNRVLFREYQHAYRRVCELQADVSKYGTWMNTLMEIDGEIHGEIHSIYRLHDSSAVEIHIFPRYVN